MFGLYAWIYEQVSQRTSERIKIALTTKAKRGEYKGSIPPYGYRLENKALYLADDGSPEIVRYIYSEYINGVGFDKIARSLSKRGIPTPSTVAQKSNASKYWHGSTVKKILSNLHYVGDLVQGREETISVTSNIRRKLDKEAYIVIPDTHEAIIKREVFELTQQLMLERQRKRPKSSPHLFTNFVFCSDCGSGMWYRSNRKGYLCGSYSKHGRIACSHHFVREVHLEEVILTRLNKAAERLKNVDHNSERSVLTTETLKQLHKSIKEVEQSLLEITTKKRKYLTLLSEDVLTHPEYREAMDSLHEATLHLNIKRSELNRSLQLIKSNVNSHVHAFLEQAPFKKVTKKQLATFVKRIEVNETGEFIT